MIMNVDAVLARWRVALSDKLAARYEGFMSRQGAVVRALVAAWLARRSVRKGEDPEAEEEFAAYDAIVPMERARDAQPDRAVIAEVLKEVNVQIGNGYSSRLVLSNFGLEYVDSRIEAIIIRGQGWDVVPLMLESPALVVVVQERVVAFRSAMGTVKIRPDLQGTLNHLYPQFRKAEDAVLALRQKMGDEWDTPDRLQEYAVKMWTAARLDITSGWGSDRGMTVRIQREGAPGRSALNLQKRVSSLAEASREYRRAVEESGEGASTFPAGELLLPNGPTYQISYNGRIWDDGRRIYPEATAGEVAVLDEPAGAEPRPRAREKAYRWLANKLEADLRQGVSISDVMYHSPVIDRRGDALVIEYQAQGGRTLVLWVAPLAGYAGRPLGGPVDVQGELRERQALVASFPWTIVERSDLAGLSDATAAAWFARPVSRPRKLVGELLAGLVALKEEEDNAPGAMHMWSDTPRTVQDALIKRGYVNALTNDHGGFAHYALTAAGRTVLPPSIPTWMVARTRVKRIDGDDAETGAGSTRGSVIRVLPETGCVSIEQDDGQVAAWPIAQVSLELERPKSRGPWLVFWDLPFLAIKGTIPAGRTGEAVSREMEARGFYWHKTLGRYQRPADHVDGWPAAKEIVELLTPGEPWSTPTDKVLRHIARLPEGASGWSGPGGPKVWEGTNGTLG